MDATFNTELNGAFAVHQDDLDKLHERFNEAGIVINYPIRHLVVDDVPEDGESADREPTPPEQIVEFVRKG